MADIRIELQNAIHMKIECERSIEMEMYEVFAFRAKNYKFHPKYKNKLWDGYIRLFDLRSKSMYIGLLHLLEMFAEERGYTISYGKNVRYGDKISSEDIINLCDKIKCSLKPHDYQIKYIKDAIKDGRSLNLSPTSSGKSLIQYILSRFYMEEHDCRILIIVPRTQLTVQMRDDFIEYGCNPKLVGMVS